MRAEFLDPFSRGTTLCHRWPVGLKLALTVAATVAALTIPRSLSPLLGGLAAVVGLGHVVARIPLAYLVRRLAGFAILAAALSISVATSPHPAAGWEAAAWLVARSVLVFLIGLWLVNTTPFEDLLAAAQRCGAPALLVALLAFMYRYIYVLFDELARLRAARAARSFGRSRLTRAWRTNAHLIGLLLIRALDRAERIYGAMCARGWNGRIRRLD